MLAAAALLAVGSSFAEDLVYDVPENETVTVETDINADTADVDELVKTGKGTLVISGQVGATRNFKRLDVQGGRVDLAKGSGGFRPDIHICKDAIFELKAEGGLHSTTVIDVDKGGVMSFGGFGDTVNGFRGSGVVTNWTSKITLSLSRGPHLFSGTAVTTGGALYEVYQANNNPESAIVVGASEAFRKCTLRLGWGSYTANTNLLFAGGIGKFVIEKLDFESNSRVVFLEDLDGNPITLYAGPYNGYSDDKVRLRGRGTYLATVSDGLMGGLDVCTGFTGWFGSAGANIKIGDKGAKPDYSTIAGLLMTKDFGADPRLQYKFTDCEPLHLTCPFVARSGGRIDMPGSFIFDETDVNGLLITLPGVCSNLVVNGGLFALDAESGMNFGKNTPETKLVVNGGLVCGTLQKAPGRRHYSKLYWPMPFKMGTVYAQNSYVINGGELYMREPVPHRVFVNGGRFSLTNEIFPNQGSAEDPSILLFDGGTLCVRGERGTVLTIVSDANKEKLQIHVGAKGMTIDVLDDYELWTDYYHDVTVHPAIITATGVAQDGGLFIRGGSGRFYFKRPLLINGPFRVRDCKVSFKDEEAIRAATAPFFGTGDCILGSLRVQTDGDVTHTWTNRFGTAPGAKVRLAGAPTFRLRESANRAALTFELGELERERGSALFLMDNSSGVGDYDPDVSGTVRTAKPPAVEDAATGLLSVPVFSVMHKDGWRLGLLAYDTAADRFVAFTNYTEGVVDGTVARISQAAVTIPDNTSVAVKALVLASSSTFGDLMLTVGAGSTLTIGNGVDPAKLVGNPTGGSKSARIGGSGTIDFGTSEGVITTAPTYETRIDPKISGSGGVSFVSAVFGSYNEVRLFGDNDYTGGTVVSDTVVVPYSNTALGAGKVRLDAGQLTGGRIEMKSASPITIANDIEAAGFGPTDGDVGQYGAFYSSGAGTLTLAGKVELAGKTRAGVKNAGAKIVFANTVSGDVLQTWGGAGKVVLAAANSYTGGTEVVNSTLRVEGAGTLGTGKVTLDGGTLELAVDAKDVRAIVNAVDGVGKVVLSGKGEVDFGGEMAKGYGADLTLALGAKRATVNSLAGFSSVTNTCAEGSTLYVTGDSAFSGTVAPGVTVVKGKYTPPGMLLIVR